MLAILRSVDKVVEKLIIHYSGKETCGNVLLYNIHHTVSLCCNITTITLLWHTSKNKYRCHCQLLNRNSRNN